MKTLKNIISIVAISLFVMSCSTKSDDKCCTSKEKCAKCEHCKEKNCTCDGTQKCDCKCA